MTNVAALEVDPHKGANWAIRKNVQVLLILRDEPQVDLAKALGLSPQLMSHKLRGRRPWTPDEIEGAARHFRVTIDSLFRLPDLDSNQEPAGDVIDAQERFAARRLVVESAAEMAL